MLRDERGFTMIEVAIAALLVAVGLSAVAAGFNAPQRLTQTAERQTQAAQIAETDLENLVGRPYANIAVTSLPAWAEDTYPSQPGYAANHNNPSNPLYYVNDPTFYTGTCSGTTFAALKNYHNAAEGQLAEAPSPTCGEPLVPASTTGVPFSESTKSLFSGAPEGTVYNFITYRIEKCGEGTSASVIDEKIGNLFEQILKNIAEAIKKFIEFLFGSKNAHPPAQELCSGSAGLDSKNEKRITVAVVLTQPGSKPGLMKPVYVSTVVPNPEAGAPPPTEKTCFSQVAWLFGC